MGKVWKGLQRYYFQSNATTLPYPVWSRDYSRDGAATTSLYVTLDSYKIIPRYCIFHGVFWFCFVFSLFDFVFWGFFKITFSTHTCLTPSQALQNQICSLELTGILEKLILRLKSSGEGNKKVAVFTASVVIERENNGYTFGSMRGFCTSYREFTSR